MAALDAGLILKRAARTLMLGAIGLPLGAYTQSAFDLASTDAQRELVDEIREIEARDGPDSPSLVEPWTALGLLYQESEDYVLSIGAIEQALQLERRIEGLYSLDQAPLMQRLIDNHEALGNPNAAWNLEQELLLLVSRHPNDLRSVPVLREVADNRIDVLRRYMAGEFPPQLVLGCFFNPHEYLDLGNCHAGRQSHAVRSLIEDARAMYRSAIDVITRNDRYSSDDLRELEMEIVSNAYRYGAAYPDSGSYEIGKESLERIVDYEAAAGASSLTRVDALVRLADWDLLYSPSRAARDAVLDRYVQAYDELKREGVAQASIDAIFSPATPILLPGFVQNPLTSATTADSTEYIEVAFELTPHGESRRMRILDETTGATYVERNWLRRFVKRGRFRPVMTDGRFADSTPVVARYYFGE
jgi:tetratricopeptide (TPR) repeat protein